MIATVEEYLQSLPDWADRPAAEARLADWIAKARTLRPTPDAIAATVPIDVGGPSGTAAFLDARWRRLALATLAADFAIYDPDEDRVDFPRLNHVLAAFPQGFRLWWTPAAAGGFVPVGYSGWYPIAPAVFERLATRPASVTDRGEMAPAPLGPAPIVYLFSYGVAAPLRKTDVARRLLAALADDIRLAQPGGLAAITVSEDGARVARRFGMKASGNVSVGGGAEVAFVRRG